MTRKTNPETKGSEAQKGLQKVVPKEPPGHVRDTHLFTLSRPRRAAVSLQVQNRSLGLRNPPTLHSPGCRLGFLLRSRVGAAAAAASMGGRTGVSSLALAPTSGGGTAAGRELSLAEAVALRCQDAAVRRFGDPYWGQEPALPAELPPTGERGISSSVLHPSPFSLAQFPASGFSSKDLFPQLKCCV